MEQFRCAGATVGECWQWSGWDRAHWYWGQVWWRRWTIGWQRSQWRNQRGEQWQWPSFAAVLWLWDYWFQCLYWTHHRDCCQGSQCTSVIIQPANLFESSEDKQKHFKKGTCSCHKNTTFEPYYTNNYNVTVSDKTCRHHNCPTTTREAIVWGPTWVPKVDPHHNTGVQWGIWLWSLSWYVRNVDAHTINLWFFCLYIVLVSHNGYRFDFPMLLAEIERRPEKLALSQLLNHRIHFSDTLGYLKEVRFIDSPINVGTCTYIHDLKFYRLRRMVTVLWNRWPNLA